MEKRDGKVQQRGSDYFKDKLQKRRRMKTWQRTVLCLSCIVVFCTVYALILPALTLERKTVCGKEEHVHTEVCYENLQEKSLICGKEEHRHSDTCYTDDSGEDSADPSGNRDAEDGTITDETVENNTKAVVQDQDSYIEEDSADQKNETKEISDDVTERSKPDTVVASENEENDAVVAATDGFDLSNAAEEKIGKVALFYQEQGSDTWTELSTDNINTIPGDARIKLSVGYKNIDIKRLQDEYASSLTYNLPELLRNAVAEGKIMDGTTVAGFVQVVGEKVVLTFDNEYLDSLLDQNKNSIDGDFYAVGEMNLSKLPTDGTTVITIAGKDYKFNFGEDPVAQYGKVDVQKECTSTEVISNDDGDYLSYTITVTAGEDGGKDISVVDIFQTESKYVSYVGISSEKRILSGTENGQQPYETVESGKNHGSIYQGNIPTSDQPIPVEGTESITAPGSLVWKIGDMSAGESRTLTYFVKLEYDQMSTDKHYMNKLGEIKNHAAVYSKTYPKSYDESVFKPELSYKPRKEKAGDIVRNTDGTYTINYKLSFDLYKEGSNFSLRDFEFQDYLNHEQNKTDENALPYINYDRSSLKVYAKKHGETDYTQADKKEYTEVWAQDGNSFTVKINENVNPGDSYYVTYSLILQPEAMAALKANNLDVNNRLIVSASNADKSKKTGFEAWGVKNTIAYDTWDVKQVGNGTVSDQTITMAGERYEINGDSVTKDSSESTEFTVPAGSYPYTVDTNKLGDWDMTDIKMTDTLSSEYMQYVGYVRVDAYDPNAADGGSVSEPKETKWLKIDGQNSFTVTPSQLGWTENHYAYRFTYYAQPIHTDAFSEVSVTNRFTLSGEVVGDGEKFDITGITAEKEVTISGNYSMNVRKLSWYYEDPVAGAVSWSKGKIYWVIEVDGTAIRKGMQIRDTVLQNKGQTISYLHSDSLEGIYQGTLPEDKAITGYSSVEEFKKVNGIQDITSKFKSELTNDKNFTGEDRYSELTVTAQETVLLNGDKIYFVVRTEPETLSVSAKDVKEFGNGVSTSDDGETWLERGNANKILCAGGEILKELGQTFVYDGTTVTNIDKVSGVENGKTSLIDKNALSGAGLYTSWSVTLNYAGELSGRYQVLEQIPDGMELTYIRLRKRGKQADTDNVQSFEIENLSTGWEKKTNTANLENGKRITTISYVKGNQALIELGDFTAGNVKEDYAVSVQIVCKVTDKDVLLGGETKTFINQAILQTTDGQEISSATSPADLEMKNLTKEGQTNKEKVTFTIETNQLGQKLPTEEGMTKLKLIDKLSSTLLLDTSTIKAVNTKTGERVEINASLGEDNILELELPCDIPITITYTATVNAPPGQTVSFSNNAYWEGYSSSSGSSVKKDDYSYDAGGTVTPGKTIKLKIIKKDKNNLAQGLKGATFEMVQCTLDLKTKEITEDSTSYHWNGTTDENGQLSFGTGTTDDEIMLYNTIYKVTETKAPDGYVLESDPYYIIVPKVEDEASEYTEYVKQCIADSRIQEQYQSTYELTVSNHRGEITVEKYFQNSAGNKTNPVSGTYWFGLYENPAGTGEPLQKISITYNPEDAQVKEETFTNLDLNRSYYVFELDDQGNPITDSTSVSGVNGMEYFVSYSTEDSDHSTVEGSKAISGDTVKITNQSRVQELPSTGSYGTLLFRLAGAMLIFIAVMLVLCRIKEETKEKE